MWLARNPPFQPPGQPIDVAAWRRDESFGIFPGGTKPKQMVFAPSDASSPLTIPDHPYLFKIAYSWRSYQMWSEYIAYRIGRLIDLPVPPCLIAIDNKSGDVGALVEFFYGYPEEDRPARLIHGADIISGLHRGLKGGRPHNVQENLRIGRTMLNAQLSLTWWARTMAFDALLGNSDRHTENWGFLVRRRPDGQSDYEIAPVFDNATSLGYEWKELAIAEKSNAAALADYIAKGRTHLGWDMASDVATNHFTLIKYMVRDYPETRSLLQSCAQFTMLQVATILQECTQFQIAVPLSTQRADFIYALVKARKLKLEELVGL